VTQAIIDTNVVIAGLLTNDANSPPRRILDAMLVGAFPFLLSEALLAEYRNVLLRPAIQRRHGLHETEIDRLLTAIVTNAIIRDPPPRSGAPDANDAHLWALALEGAETVLVTGDAALIAAPPATVVVMSPRDFWDSAQR
jgi:uncharacterized protein